MVGLFGRLKKGLAKTKASLINNLQGLVRGRKLDDEFYEELEDILIQADMGIDTVMEMVEEIKEEARVKKIGESEEIFPIVQEKIEEILLEQGGGLNWAEEGPTIIMVVGVNGVGKTTSIAKLAYQFKKEGKKVLLAAADTFRAAAIDQLELWAQHAGVQIIKHQEGADPAAVTYDAVKAAVSRDVDVLMVDTAGRFHNRKNLMEEVGKIKRVIDRELPNAPHEILLVLDATTGQNAVSQARSFNEMLDLTGIVLAKLDGTAKGGIVVSISKELNIPVKYIGLGEGMEDLQKFDSREFVEALFEEASRGEDDEG
ncbi:MAG: signal recognition particle-docking protein FtsY [Clostridia bacterium]|nr:signal recognition particle-docking protein FtsY [Clostridia bacterium]